MKAIFSHTYHPKKNKKHDYRIFTAFANYFAQKQGFETVFFGDDKSLESFKNIEFNYIEKISENSLKNFPNSFWSIGKLIALSSMNESCIHIDNDLFLTKPISNNFLQNDIYCFHDESYINFENKERSLKIRPKQTLNYPIISYNCGIMGGQDINTIKNSINIIFNFVSNNYNYLENTPLFEKISIIIEQIWLYQIIKSFNKEISPLIQIKNTKNYIESEVKKTGYIHLMQSKKLEINRVSIEEHLIKNNIKY
jgi:hypothetical protein